MQIDKAWINITSACNSNCIWCYAKDYEKYKTLINIEVFKKIITFLSTIKCKNVILVGGEPTLHPNLLYFIELMNSYDFQISLVTNGRKLGSSKYFENFLRYKDLLNITFSVEGLKGTHNLITNSDSFDETIKGLENSISYGLDFAVNTTLCSQNINEIEILYEKLISMGASNFSINFATPPLNSPFNLNNFLSLSTVNKVLGKILQLKNDFGFRFIFTTPFPLCVLEDSIIDSIIQRNLAVNSLCHIMSGTGISFDFNGNITPCTHFVDLNVNNIYGVNNLQDFETFWDIEYASTVRKEISRYPSIKCNECKYSYRCTGGCPLLWLNDFYYNTTFHSYEN